MNVDEVLAKMDTLDTNEEEIQYIIDENLRVISIPPLGVVLGVEGDKDVNSAKFKMVRYYKGIDLSKFEIRINFANANGDLSYYTVKNPTVTDDTLTFEWLVGYLVTKYKGTVRFVVRMITTDASTGEVQQAFDTTVGEARSLEGLLVDTPTDEKVYDIVAQLKADLTDHVNNLLETIPADYSALSGKVDENTRGISELKEDLADKVPKKDYAPETKTESMTQPVGKDENGKLWTTPGSVFAVSSVNGKTGAVVLTADDVHAMRDDTVIPTVPEKVSAFENDAGYLTAHQDISGKLDADKLPEAVNDALAQAAASGEFDGADGKSAYQYAVEGGYTGAEAEFAAKMAAEQLTGTTNELTPTQVYDAVSAGIPVKVQYTDSTYGLISFTAFNVAESINVIVSDTIAYGNGVYMLCELFGDKSDNVWGFNITTLAQKTDIPTALPTPHSLTFTGSVTGSYDGSAPLTVNIPSAVTDDHINSLIDTKLGVIENGSY